MTELYLEIFAFDSKTKTIDAPLESIIIYIVYNYCKPTAININFIIRNRRENEKYFNTNITTNYKIILKDSIPTIATYCTFPNLVFNSTVISGLCSVARQITKKSNERQLLGFRESCLMACNESSVWTKFCEIDLFNSINSLLKDSYKYIDDNTVLLPRDLTRFEHHLSQPVRIHNIYKVAQNQAKNNNKNISEINAKVSKNDLNLNHLYSEGPFMTLADLILFPLIKIAFIVFGENLMKHLPLTYKWFDHISKTLQLINFRFDFNKNQIVNVLQEEVAKQSLYISDPQRYKPKNRIFTKQQDVLTALNLVKKLNCKTDDQSYGSEVQFDWTSVPLEANPEGGALPKSRMKRKCEQLENIVKPVLKIAASDQCIVDFCSGSGHLGILLAVKLPNCKIILLENKEMSLDRARLRVEKLQLKNVVLLQCNLDYFIGDFDIGVSLHACGVATDLVIQQCLQKNAAFISCPCCYGGVHVCHHISYPRSKIFCDLLNLHDYLVLGHSADQTHDKENVKTKQGIECMNIIDTDRKLQAEEMGYEVRLFKMVPESCTPKNNILVGLPKK